MNPVHRYTEMIKAEAKRLGFDFCGVSKADFLKDEAPFLEKFLKQGMHGSMSYLENHFDKRLDPRLLVPDAKSVISLLLNYYPQQQQLQNGKSPKISKYAYGKDYHVVIKDKLKALLYFIQTEIGDVGGRGFVDSAPVLDRAWAKKAGLGWMGKNGNLITKGHGSFFFIAELILDLDLIPSVAVQDYCGTCTKCIEACPTSAIEAPGIVNGSKCISYYTIELKEAIPSDLAGQFKDWAFGCDICQDVCPWNRFSKPHADPSFEPIPEVINLDWNGWNELTEEVFNQVFKQSAIKRTKFKGLKRNLDFLNLTKIN